MGLHSTTGRRALGVGLSLFTAFLWGILPIALKNVLESMDAFTITWYRFLVSAVLLFPIVLMKNGLPSLKQMGGSVKWLLAAAVVGLCGNYILYLIGLNHLTPSTAAVVVQLAPVFFLAGGLAIFKERFSSRQYAGFALLLVGLGLFFNQRLGDLFSSLGEYTIGVLFIVCSALIWTVYAMAQKQLLKTYPSQTIMLIIYIGGSVLFFHSAKPGQLVKLDILRLILLFFCAVNTLIAYGSFSEALDHLEASRMSAILAVTPLFTITGMKIVEALAPGFLKPENLNGASIAGAILVVLGSIATSLSGAAEHEA